MGWLRSSGRSEVGVDRAEALVGVRGVRELLSHYDIDPLQIERKMSSYLDLYCDFRASAEDVCQAFSELVPHIKGVLQKP